MTVSLSAVLLAAFTLASWSFSNARREACRSRASTLQVLRDIIVLARDQSVRNPRLTPEQRNDARAFYRSALQRIDQSRC